MLTRVYAGGGLGTSIAVGMIPEFVQFQRFEVIVIVWLAFSAVADCAITVALVWHLVSDVNSESASRQLNLRRSVSTRPASLPRTTSSTGSSGVSLTSHVDSPTPDRDHPLAAVTVQTGLITAVCALVDLILFLATVRVTISFPISHSHSVRVLARRPSPRFQPPLVETLHELAYVQPELTLRLEVRKRRRRHNQR